MFGISMSQRNKKKPSPRRNVQRTQMQIERLERREVFVVAADGFAEIVLRQFNERIGTRLNDGGLAVVIGEIDFAIAGDGNTPIEFTILDLRLRIGD